STILLNLICVLNSQAQFSSAVININGLTCSQCSRSVEMQLKKISSIQKIDMDLKHTTATIHFKQNVTVDLTAVAKAVTNAGFSVGKFTTTIASKNLQHVKDFCYKTSKQHLQSINKPINNTNTYTLQLLGKQFGTSKPQIN